MKDFAEFESKIGVKFSDESILREALTHSSYLNENPNRDLKHNERLEFLGDAVLELIVTRYLYEHFPDRAEGELTNWRSALVKGEQLAEVAKELKIGDYLYLSRGEEASGGRKKISTLANSLEALIGAIFLDQGYESAKEFCDKFILVRLQELLKQGKDRDEKSVFQERAQEIMNITPHYRVVSEKGPDHDKMFTCAVYLGDELVSEGHGNSKQRAEQDAAKKALKAKKWG